MPLPTATRSGQRLGGTSRSTGPVPSRSATMGSLPGLAAQVSALWGREQSYGGIRLGQMHYLAEWGVAGFDRVIGINAPLRIDGPITASVPFAFGEHQLGAEAFFVHGANRLSAQMLNGVNREGMGSAADQDTRKDFLVTDQILIDSAGSGIQGVALAIRPVGEQGPWGVAHRPLHVRSFGRDAVDRLRPFRIRRPQHRRGS